LANPPLWIDVTDRATENTFVFIDGSAVDVRRFANGQPNDAGADGQDCLTATATGWNDLNCSTATARVACEAIATSAAACIDADGDGFGVGCARGPDCNDGDRAVAAASAVVVDTDGDGASVVTMRCLAPLLVAPPPANTLPTVPDCDDANIAVTVGCVCRTAVNNGRVFSLCSEHHSWDVWSVGCVERGGLAVFQGSGDQNTVRNTLDSAGVLAAWINGSDEAVEGDFVAADGSALPFVRFGSGEPNNLPGDGAIGGENCLEVRGNSPFVSGDVNDAVCGLHKAGLCGPLPPVP
jgi:hypothetical protein